MPLPRVVCWRLASAARRVVVCVGAILMTVDVMAAEPGNTALLDCPLRDAPFSIHSPLMDILLSPQAVAVANAHLDGALDQIPPFFAGTQAPSFSAILTLASAVAMDGRDTSGLAALDAALGQLPVTDDDRRARCARYDADELSVTLPEGAPRILVFQKMTGFRDGPSVEAALAALQALATEHGWALVVSDRGGVMTPENLARFDLVIWNNVSGDVLTLSQRRAFEDYINGGGGYLGMHGSAGDPVYFWPWYVDTLIGAQFIGHTMDPQFQDARLVMEPNVTGVGKGLDAERILNDEWYSFSASPRAGGATVIATLDESSYSPIGRGGQNVSMGEDHPIVWARCVGKGRSFYSAIGHRPDIYSDSFHRQLLVQGVQWAASAQSVCS